MDEKDTSNEIGRLRDAAGSDDSAFQHDLEELVLRAFGEGDEIEGVWDLEYAPEEIPDWTVTIDRKDGI